MNQDKHRLKDFGNVDLVIDAGGLGSQADKIRKYNLMTGAQVYRFIRLRGIKIFFPNEWGNAGTSTSLPWIWKRSSD